MERLSYISEPRYEPYRYSSVVDVLREHASQRPEQEILIHRRQNGERLSITNKELDQKSTSLANYLYSVGTKQGCSAAIVGPNTLEWVVGELGILKTGAASVHVSISKSDAQDAMDMVVHSSCGVVLLEPGIDMVMAEPFRALQNRIDEWNIEAPDKQIKTILLRRCSEFDSYTCLEDVLKMRIYLKLPSIFPEYTALVYSTSGSTGCPKLVKLNHFHVLHRGQTMLKGQCEKFFNDRPFAWIGGNPLALMISGIPRLFTETHVSFQANYENYVWNAIKEEKCSQAMIMPHMISKIWDYKKKLIDDEFRLKSVYTGGQMIGRLHTQALKYICTESVINTYGSTENGVMTTKEIRSDCPYLLGNVGTCVSGVEIKIVQDNGDTAVCGISGEVYTRSNVMSQGYLNDSERNKDLFAEEGWTRTGDIGLINEDGDLILVGRKKNVISRGTRKLIPTMIEEVVSEIPGLKEVVVIPVPDKRLYEEVCVCYVTEVDATIDSEKLKLLCRELFLTVKTEDGVGESPTYFVELKEIPLLSTGKIDKETIKKMAVSILNIHY